MHKLLQRQLRRYLASGDAIPDEWQSFVAVVDEAYIQADFDRTLLERSMELTSQELLERNQRLRQDIVERQQVEEALRDSQETYRAVVAQAADGIYLLDIQTLRFLETNAAYQEMLGYTAEELLQLTFYDVSTDNRKNIEANIQRIVLERHVFLGERELRCKDGSLVVVEASLKLISHRGKEILCAVVHDVTEHLRRQALVFQTMNDAVVITDTEGFILDWNHAAEGIYGYSKDEVLGRSRNMLRRPEEAEAVSAIINESMRKPGYWLGEVNIIRKDGSERVLEGKFVALNNEHGVWSATIGVYRDVTESKRAEKALRESEERYRSVAETATDAIFTIDEESTISFANRASERMFGYAVDEMLGQKITMLMPEYPGHLHETAVKRSNATSKRNTTLTGVEVLGIHKSGREVPLEISFGELVKDGRRTFTSIVRDITERKVLSQQLHHQAFHDSLTNLPNRILFMDRLEHAMARAVTHSGSVAVLFLDLDNFKLINDSMGHEVGDELLIAVSQRIQACVRQEDTIARLGGDEFLVLLEDITDVSDAIRLAERIAQQVRVPLTLGRHDSLRSDSLTGHELVITASIGIALQSEMRGHPDDLLRRADMAMYEAKSGGKANHVVFEPEMTFRVQKYMQMERELRRALDREEFRIYYQPIISLKSGNISGMEALIRWEHPELGLISPGEFIPVAEQSGLIVPIGQWVLREACRQLREWQEQKQWRQEPGDENLMVSVNLSARQFQHPQLVDDIERTLQESRLDPGHLKLEITESIAMTDMESAVRTLHRLKEIGIRLALDDFGMGHSALGYLKRFPIDTLKLDRVFIAGLGQNSEDAAIVRATIAFAKALGLSVTAEGIETAQQLSELQALNCDEGQGYFFARPMPPDQVSAQFMSAPCSAVSQGSQEKGLTNERTLFSTEESALQEILVVAIG